MKMKTKQYQLPHRQTPRQKLIIGAVKDFFGEANQEEKKLITKISLLLMGRKKKMFLTDEERETKEAIRRNLADKTYISSFPSVGENITQTPLESVKLRVFSQPSPIS